MPWTVQKRSVALIAAIAVLLPLLAILQYQWLGELSGLEQMRARQNLEAGTVRLSTEFDARLASLYASLSAIDLDATNRALERVAPAGFVKELRVISRADLKPGAPAWLESATRRTLLDEVPAIVVPDKSRSDRWLVAMLDMDHIANDLIPEMLAGCFARGGGGRARQGRLRP